MHTISSAGAGCRYETSDRIDSESPAEEIDFADTVEIQNGRAYISAPLDETVFDEELIPSGAVYVYDVDRQSLADVNSDSSVDANDIDTISEAIRNEQTSTATDLNGDGATNETDRLIWVEALQHTYFGDSDLDGEFSSSDFVRVFSIGEYEDDIDLNSTWGDGDWDGNGDFDSSDFVTAFTSGGFEKGPRAGVAAVPEPNLGMSTLLVIGMLTLRVSRLRRRNRN